MTEPLKPCPRCEKCTMLLELYGATAKTHRLYWVMTEIFVMLHGGDVCNEWSRTTEAEPDQGDKEG